MQDLVIYTDGGCSGNPGPGGWGYVIIDDQRESGGDVRESPASGGEKVTTNNRMELTAVISALKAVSSQDEYKGRSISVYTDSQYVQKGITQWVAGWKRNGWRTASKAPVKNQDLWMTLDALSAALSPRWVWVKGHAGVKYNEMVDRMTQDEILAIGLAGK